jgi:hypothetical protein
MAKEMLHVKLPLTALQVIRAVVQPGTAIQLLASVLFVPMPHNVGQEFLTQFVTQLAFTLESAWTPVTDAIPVTIVLTTSSVNLGSHAQSNRAR